MNGLEVHRNKLQSWLADVAGAREVEIKAMRPLTGGTIQENWRIECIIDSGPNLGRQVFVVRSDAPSGVASSLSRSQEFKVLCAADSAGVTVPEPLWLCEDTDVIGRAFYVMRRVEGIALQQAHRHLSGSQQSLELALTGRLLPDLELRVLNMTAPTAWRPS